MQVRIGFVSDIDGAKAHLDSPVRARQCQYAGRKMIRKATTTPAAADRCLFCFTDENIGLAQIENNSSDTNWNATIDEILCDMVTPSPEPFVDVEGRAAIIAAWTAAGADLTTGLIGTPATITKPRSFAELVGGYGTRANAVHLDKAARRRAGRHANV